MSAWEDWECLQPKTYAFENPRLVCAHEREHACTHEKDSATLRKRKASLRPKPRKRRQTMHDVRWNMRLPAHLSKALEELARSEGVTGSEWIRRRIEREARIARLRAARRDRSQTGNAEREPETV